MQQGPGVLVIFLWRHPPSRAGSSFSFSRGLIYDLSIGAVVFSSLGLQGEFCVILGKWFCVAGLGPGVLR